MKLPHAGGRAMVIVINYFGWQQTDAISDLVRRSNGIVFADCAHCAPLDLSKVDADADQCQPARLA